MSFISNQILYDYDKLYCTIHVKSKLNKFRIKEKMKVKRKKVMKWRDRIIVLSQEKRVIKLWSLDDVGLGKGTEID